MVNETWESFAREFEEKFNFPFRLGAIDGKHCQIQEAKYHIHGPTYICITKYKHHVSYLYVQAFPGCGSQNFNYKGTHSVVLLAIASANHVFIAFDIGAPGRQSDGGILSQSCFGKALVKHALNIPPKKVFIADEAFPLQKHIMRPIPGKQLGDDEIIFNCRLSRARMSVENTFGIVASRWRIYRRPVIGKPHLAKGIIKATVCLHNWLLLDEEPVDPAARRYGSPNLLDTHNKNGEIITGQWRIMVTSDDALCNLDASMHFVSNRYSTTSASIREMFTNFFLSSGQIVKQWNKLPV
ncbi:hypothetical protein PR048_018626 [Dryococelus australis]|uniref:DDE Tnp4 domain-containing protein n=1 Tax=Dryococelus australis TaxID=614101 RepID=A0ABQ9HCV1_9NEOP|nr:hypothetical protein PR048_018626 [Dryococelus australis]